MSAFRAFRHCDDDDEEEAGAEKKEEKDENNDDDDRFLVHISHSSRNAELRYVHCRQFQPGITRSVELEDEEMTKKKK